MHLENARIKRINLLAYKENFKEGLKPFFKVFCAIFISAFIAGALFVFFPQQLYAAEKIELFGTKEFKSRITSIPQWVEVIERNAASPILIDGFQLNAQNTWNDFIARVKPLSPKEQLREVNLFWNKWPYRLDDQVYGLPDYWAIPQEFHKNSGDCEDYAIIKYFTLKELGFNPDDMRIIVVMETIRNIAHAVLGVYIDGDVLILDNLSNAVLSHTKLGNYEPQYSLNEKFRWGHVKSKKQ